MRRLNMRVVVAVLAVFLAFAGIASLVVWTNNARDRAFSGTETIPVYQVTKNVAAGTEAESIEGSVEQRNLPKAGVPATAVTSLDSLRGKVTTVNLVPGEVLVSGRFGSDSDVQEIKIPKGLQEVTLELASTRILGGVLKRGDRVGVLASYTTQEPADGVTNFAVNRALVLAVTSQAANGQQTVEQQAAATPGGTIQVRLALNSLGVERVVNASEFGKVWLSRQGKEAEVDRQRVNIESVLK